MSAYFDKVTETAVLDVQAAGPGLRNATLNKAAFSLGRHAHMRSADVNRALEEVNAAAAGIGLPAHEIKATVGSGFKRGLENPRTVDENDTPFQPSELDRLITRLATDGLLVRDDEQREEDQPREADADRCRRVGGAARQRTRAGPGPERAVPEIDDAALLQSELQPEVPHRERNSRG